jgi:hypothetical protein
MTLSEAERQGLQSAVDVLVYSVDADATFDFDDAVRDARRNVEWFLLGCLWVAREGAGLDASEKREVRGIVQDRTGDIRRAVEKESSAVSS